MDLTIFEKIVKIFKYIFSSFLSVELFIFSLLLFILLIVNLKRKEKLFIYFPIVIYLGLLIGTLLAYNEYVILSVKAFFKLIISYICFPTIEAFYMSMVFITVIMIYTLFSKEMTKFKKIFNYLFFSILYFFFMSVISLTSYNGLDFGSLTNLYSNETVLVLIQGSNSLLLIWIIFTFFYRLYLFYQKKFDEEII